MSELLVAVSNFKSLGAQLKKFIAVADELEKLGQLDEAAAAAQARLDKLQADGKELEERLARRRSDADQEISDRQHDADLKLVETRNAQFVLDQQVAGRQAELDRLSRELEAVRAEHDRVVAAHKEFLARVKAE